MTITSYMRSSFMLIKTLFLLQPLRAACVRLHSMQLLRRGRKSNEDTKTSLPSKTILDGKLGHTYFICHWSIN